jgi:heme-degrading monooxygenase HmoA
MNVGVRQCVRVVPSRIKEGALEAWLAVHEAQHTPAVRRQPGFVAKALLQAEDDKQNVAMLLVWQTTKHATDWTNHAEHDVVSQPMREFVDPGAGRVAAMPRGGWTILALTGPGS